MTQTLTALKLRSALGETNIVLDMLQRMSNNQTISLEEAVHRLQKAANTLEQEAKLVEARKTPTLKFGDDILEHSINFDCIEGFLKTKDEL